MGLFEAFEKLINEHGSAAILREHLSLVKSQYAALESECKNLQAQYDQARLNNAQLSENIGVLKRELQKYEAAGARISCDHCGSHRLKRAGNRPDPMFGEVGIKQAIFTCLDCGEKTYDTLIG